MTDSMNFGPDWIRNLSSEGSTAITGGGTTGGTRYQLAEFRYGREEMLALFDKNAKPPASVTNFKCLYSEQCLSPLALLPTSEEDMLTQQQPPVIRGWQSRPGAGGGGLGGVPTLGRGGGRGGSMDRGGRPSRGRGYQYGGGGRGTYDGSWGGPGAAGGPGVQGDPTGDQWSPRKEYSGGRGGMENWRRSRPMSDEHLSGEPGSEGAGWRRMPAPTSSMFEKWGRSTSWRDSTGAGGDEDRPPTGVAERQRGGSSWTSGGEGGGRLPLRRPGGGGSGTWDHEDHLPEWATENPADGGGSFDDKGAFHGSDDEQLDGRVSNRREQGLQKSTSQQHISTKTHPPPLSSSKSSMSLVNKPEDSARKKESQKPMEEDQNRTKENNAKSERKKSVPSIPEKVDKEILVQERAKSEGPQRTTSATDKSHQVIANGPLPEFSRTSEEPDFEKLQEDFVLKLVVDEEPPRQQHQRHPPGGFEPPSGTGVTSATVPPNLAPPPTMHHQQPSPQQNDKWFYQDPQGQTQGPFTDVEMAEWYKAGYFSNQLKVRRHHDERYFLLGELIALCGGASNPFSIAALRFPPLKADATAAGAPGGPASPSVVGGKDAVGVVAAAAAVDLLQLQYLSQMAAYKQAQARVAMAAEPWGAAAALQHEMAAAQQRLMMQQQVPQDLQYMQQPPTANPLMHMINQMQQANKLPGQGLDVKPPNMPGALDPHLQLHVGNLLSMQNRIPPADLASGLPTGLAPTLTGGLPPETIPGLQAPAAAVSLGPNGLPLTGLATATGAAAAIPRPPDQIPGPQGGSQQDQDPISSLLKQLQQQKQQSQQIDSLWQQNQYGIPPTTAPPAGQWSAPNDVPLSMWDIQQSAPPICQPPSAAPVAVSQQQNQTPASQNVPQVPVTEPEKEQTVHTPKKEKEKEISRKEEKELKEAKKKKEQEEKQAKKDAEEKKRQESKKQEAEKKAAEEKKRKEEERIKKELEKVKREAEEKRQRELEEKRRLKEQRKAEEENRKKLEEQRKAEEQQRAEEERLRVERELETKRDQQARVAKSAPWSQSNSTAGMSLAEIQKAEREKRAQDAVIQMQKLQEQEILQQKEQEKVVSGIQLNWAKKPMEPRKVKSLAEIQAEEQERLAKQLAESRLQKEKEPPQIVTNTSSSIWNGQNLTWATASAQSTQWSATSVAVAGFWER
nr:unnamed protein product [Callosobruchus analis]